MKKETKNNRGNAQSRYVSPMAEVVDVNVQGVLCQSGENDNNIGNMGRYGIDEW